MFRLYGHPQVYHVYKNAKIILKLTHFLLTLFGLQILAYNLYVYRLEF
jgi:hypothetical protein